MIVHSYLTSGFFEWGKLFLESLKIKHGEEFFVKLDTRDLDNNQINDLYNIYSNLEIVNKNIDYYKLSEEIDESIDNIIKAKKSMEKREQKVKGLEITGKQFISVNDRYRDSLISLIKSLDGGIVLHFDIDTFFRNRIDPIIERVKSSDVSIIYRPHLKSPRKKIFGTFLGFKINKKSKKFAELGEEEINSVSLLKRQHNFGQISLYTIYCKLQKNINGGKIPIRGIDTKKSKGTAILGTANSGGKQKSLNECRKYLNSIKGK